MIYTASIENRCSTVALQSENVLLIRDKLHIPNKNKCNITISFQPFEIYFISCIVNKNFDNSIANISRTDI